MNEGSSLDGFCAYQGSIGYGYCRSIQQIEYRHSEDATKQMSNNVKNTILKLCNKNIFFMEVNNEQEKEANDLKKDAFLLEKLGCFAIVLEKVPAKLAEEVAKSLSIPVIGIGAGNGVDGQVLVTHDMLGMTHEFHPRFLRRYLDLYSEMTNAFENYISDVKSIDFPNDNEQY